MAVELTDLRYFVAVAEEGHVTRAAERLGMQQPPLSARIKQLETKLEVQLFRRKARGMELTEAGRSLFQDAKDLLARLDQALVSSRSIARGEQGALRIGIAPTAPFHPFVPRSIRAFRAAHPRVALTLSEGLSNEVQRELTQKQSDVAFVRVARLTDDQLTVDLLFDEPLIAALPTSHRLARGRRDPLPSLDSLQADAFILYGPPGTGLYDETVRACAKAGFVPTIGQHAPRIASTLGLVAAGMGVALVPASMRHGAVDGVAYRRLPAAVDARVAMGLASRRHDPSAVVRSFVSLVTGAAQTFRQRFAVARQRSALLPVAGGS
jgi:DNA-binding transcriptional LysR family regulator